jgi:hypothetical protein
VTPAGYSANAPLEGVVMTSGQTGGIIPLATHGGLWTANVATGYYNGLQGYVKKSTGVGRVTFTPGSGATASGTFAVAATGGGCTTEPAYSVTVSGGVITSVVGSTAMQNGTLVPAGCTSAPSITNSMIVTAGATGLTGAIVTMQWPAAGVVQASGPTDGVIAGTAAGFVGGTDSTGNGITDLKAVGMY